MTLKYVALAEADMAGQRRFSPGDRLPARTRPQPALRPQATVPPGPTVPVRQPGNASRAKLTEDHVRAVRGLLRQGTPRKEVAEQFGVSVHAIKEIALG